MFEAPAPPRCGEPGILLPSIRTNVLDDPRMTVSVHYLPIDPYFGGSISPAHLKREALPAARKYFANMETQTHEIGV